MDVHELLRGALLAGKSDSAPWNAKKGKGPMGPLGRALPKGPSSVPPTVRDGPHVVPSLGAPPVAGVVSAPSPTPQDVNKPTEDMV